MRAMHLINLFMAGCIASSFLGWLASTHAIVLKGVSFFLIGVLIIWGLCWILDDSLSSWLKISLDKWQALLVAFFSALVIGMGVFLCA